VVSRRHPPHWENGGEGLDQHRCVRVQGSVTSLGPPSQVTLQKSHPTADCVDYCLYLPTGSCCVICPPTGITRNDVINHRSFVEKNIVQHHLHTYLLTLNFISTPPVTRSTSSVTTTMTRQPSSTSNIHDLYRRVPSALHDETSCKLLIEELTIAGKSMMEDKKARLVVASSSTHHRDKTS
jgi:hypothetical protein